MKTVLWCLRAFSSFKTEVKVVLISLSVILILPVLAVLVVASSGLNAISSSLVAINPVTHLIEVHDPDGKIVAQLTASTVWPVRGKVTLEFGEPDPPYQSHHTGIDIAKGVGEPITPFMTGKVNKVDTNPNNSTGYGEYVMVDHGNNITSLYAHMSEVKAITRQDVKPGDIIGLEGQTGHAIGSHLHFEIRVYGVPVNPRIFMVGDPIQ
ncbi:MAG TPA: M23 family metallopeptidase [Patescibacteria group bacterium]|nr:M23 family metallopeptidase [Patescibacteria group bacterium]